MSVVVDLLSHAHSLLPASMGQPAQPLQLGAGRYELRASTTVHVALDEPATLLSPPLNPTAPMTIDLDGDTAVWGAANDALGGSLWAMRVVAEVRR